MNLKIIILNYDISLKIDRYGKIVEKYRKSSKMKQVVPYLHNILSLI